MDRAINSSESYQVAPHSLCGERSRNMVCKLDLASRIKREVGRSRRAPLTISQFESKTYDKPSIPAPVAGTSDRISR